MYLVKSLKIVFFAALVANSAFVKSQEENLLHRIQQEQVTEDDFYDTGLFPCQITLKKGRKTVEDNNVFFTALTIYTLKSIQDSLSSDDWLTVEGIFDRSRDLFRRYKNRKGDITYNFYQTDPDIPIPNLKRSRSEKSKLPDDLDDTSILYLILEGSSDSLLMEVKRKMTAQSFHEEKIPSTLRAYRKSRAYRTWFADRMKQDLDLCVMCNVLTFVFQNELALDTVDTETISTITNMIRNGDHVENKRLVSCYYQSTPIILYHVSRLISVANHPELNRIKDTVVQEAIRCLNSTGNLMEKVILLSSLYRLGEESDFELSMDRLEEDMDDFYWFTASPFCGRRLWIRKLVGKSDCLHLKYKSRAYYLALIQELKVLSGATMRSTGSQGMVLFKGTEGL